MYSVSTWDTSHCRQPSRHMTSIERRLNVDATVASTLRRRCINGMWSLGELSQQQGESFLWFLCARFVGDGSFMFAFVKCLYLFGLCTRESP